MARKSPATAELISPDKTGLLFDYGDTDTLFEQMKTLYLDAEKRTTLLQQANANVKAHYAIEHYVAGVESILKMRHMETLRMFEFLNPQFRHIRSRHNLSYQQKEVQGATPVTSIVIPCTGADFVEEATLSALFASRFAPDAEEMVIVSDQPAAQFGELPRKPGW